MKPLIPLILLALSPILSTAEVIADAQRKGGGSLKLTDTKCRKEEGRAALITNGQGQFVSGCWQVFDDQIVILWSDGEKNVYPISAFDIRKSGAESAARGKPNL